MALVIQTKYTGPTDARGSKIKAKHSDGNLSQPYNHAWEPEENHQCAAEMLAVKLNIAYKQIQTGILPDGTYAHFLF